MLDRFSMSTKLRILDTIWGNMMSSLFEGKSYIPSFDHIANAYSDSHRLYHNVDHIFEMLEEFDKLKHLMNDPLSVQLAIFYHDYVYDVKSNTNEEDSARAIGMNTGLTPMQTAEAERLVMATRHLPGAVLSGDERWIVDLDLMRFGVYRQDFWSHGKAIRSEYSYVSDELYNHNRKNFLLELINRDHIFNNSLIRARYESMAVENISWAIRELNNENS